MLRFISSRQQFCHSGKHVLLVSHFFPQDSSKGLLKRIVFYFLVIFVDDDDVDIQRCRFCITALVVVCNDCLMLFLVLLMLLLFLVLFLFLFFFLFFLLLYMSELLSSLLISTDLDFESQCRPADPFPLRVIPVCHLPWKFASAFGHFFWVFILSAGTEMRRRWRQTWHEKCS